MKTYRGKIYKPEPRNSIEVGENVKNNEIHQNTVHRLGLYLINFLKFFMLKITD
jgi:hypothetical protein